MILRLLTLVLVLLFVGLPYFSSSTNTALILMYQSTLNWGSLWARAAWMLWAAWMVWPVVNFLRLPLKYPF